MEIVAKNTVDLTGYRIQLYNGNDGKAYKTSSLDTDGEKVPSGNLNYVTVNYDTTPVNEASFQDGPKDGIALIDAADRVVQFIAYAVPTGSILKAQNGLAKGVEAENIGIQEFPKTTTSTSSLQLGGTGCRYSAFTWSAQTTQTQKAANVGQTINFNC